MRLIDTYALNCAATIDKPFIYETFFPIPLTKYITFQAQSQQNIDAKNYHFWQDVIDMVLPFLSKEGIQILQVGQTHELPFQRVVDIRGQTSVNQLAYIIKRAMLHVGPDSFGIHLASSFNVPLVGLYSSTFVEIAGPQFGSPDKQICFKGYERVGNKKPSFALQEDPKSINTIKPEEVANAIFKLLNLPSRVPVETIHLGKRYSHAIIREMVPNNPTMIGNPESPIEIRCDMFHDDNLLGHHLTYLQKAVVVTDKPINLKLLQRFRAHIPVIIYKITENDDPNFVKAALGAGLNVVLLSELPQESVNTKKVNYYEYGTINMVNPIDRTFVDSLKPDLSKLYFRSCKYIVSDGKLYPSHASIKAQTPLGAPYEYNKVIDTDDFWKDLEFYTLVKRLD